MLGWRPMMNLKIGALMQRVGMPGRKWYKFVRDII
jgi:hypothetical protein